MYVAAECFRFKVTGDADARANARQGMKALIRLEAITGIPGFPGALVHQGRSPNQDEQPQDGEWHDTPDRLWRWKGDTSSDEIVGHYFVYPIYYDLVADDAEKPALRAVDRSDHQSHPRQQLSAGRPRRQADALGLVGPRGDLGRPGRNRAARAAPAVAPARRAAHDGEPAVSRAVPGGVSGSDQDPQVSLADPQPEDHGARARSIIRTTSWRFCRSTRCCATRPIPRCSRSTSRASSAAGRSSGRSAIRCGTSSMPPAPARRSSTGTTRCARSGRSRWTWSSGR